MIRPLLRCLAAISLSLLLPESVGGHPSSAAALITGRSPAHPITSSTLHLTTHFTPRHISHPPLCLVLFLPAPTVNCASQPLPVFSSLPLSLLSLDCYCIASHLFCFALIFFLICALLRHASHQPRVLLFFLLTQSARELFNFSRWRCSSVRCSVSLFRFCLLQ